MPLLREAFIVKELSDGAWTNERRNKENTERCRPKTNNPESWKSSCNFNTPMKQKANLFKNEILNFIKHILPLLTSCLPALLL